jgi:hypothetical protein
VRTRKKKKSKKITVPTEHGRNSNEVQGKNPDGNNEIDVHMIERSVTSEG